ncbi:MAG: hypothetical protein J5I59_12135 [Saprospiraceae bacterium]|nr:hypothetical protein [Saprospiraceae bacterium]
MKKLIFSLGIIFILASCKPTSTNDSANASSMPVQTGNDPATLIPLENKEAEKFAVSLDSILEVAINAQKSGDTATVAKIQAMVKSFNEKRDEFSKKLSGKDVETFEGFTEKRLSTINSL